jgi:hypothetical protein
MVASTLSDQTIQAVLDNPPLVWRVIAPGEDRLYLQETGQSKPPGLIARLLGRHRDWPPDAPSFEFTQHERHEVDIDKSWDGINFCVKKLLNQTDYPNFFEGGKPVGKVEVGYGPARCFPSREVGLIADGYGSISEADLLAQFEPAAMKKVYPRGLWTKADDTVREYLAENFVTLKRFLDFAKEHRLGVIVHCT